MSDLTWDELDELVETDTIALRDRAWAEIERLRGEVDTWKATVDELTQDLADLRASRATVHDVACPAQGRRRFDLASPESMCDECRVVGLDGKPLGWADGRPSACSHPADHCCLDCASDAEVLVSPPPFPGGAR